MQGGALWIPVLVRWHIQGLHYSMYVFDREGARE